MAEKDASDVAKLTRPQNPKKPSSEELSKSNEVVYDHIGDACDLRSSHR